MNIMDILGDKKVPNPNGRKGGQAHQDTTIAIQPGGDGEITSIHQVCKVNQNGLVSISFIVDVI